MRITEEFAALARHRCEREFVFTVFAFTAFRRHLSVVHVLTLSRKPFNFIAGSHVLLESKSRTLLVTVYEILVEWRTIALRLSGLVLQTILFLLFDSSI